MARNASGTHSNVTGVPFTTGTAISSTVMNAELADLSAEITDSLSRTGKGGMSAPLVATAGSVGAPSLTFAGDTNSGLYSIGADNIGVSLAGVKVGDLATSVMQWISQVTDGASAIAHLYDTSNALSNAAARLVSWKNSGTEKLAVLFDGTLLAAAAAAIKGNSADGASAVGVVLDNAQELSNASAKLVSIRNAGNEKSYFDTAGQLKGANSAAWAWGAVQLSATNPTILASHNVASAAYNGVGLEVTLTTEVSSESAAAVVCSLKLPTEAAGYLAAMVGGYMTSTSIVRFQVYDIQSDTPAGLTAGTSMASQIVNFVVFQP